MTTGDDVRFMARALELALRGRGRTSPNPLVGAVIVGAGGTIVGEGAHLKAGGPHAEVFALAEAGERARGGTIYVTLEPCCHTGRTGPCVERIVAAGLSRVVYAVRDPNPRVAGQGAAYLAAHGLAVDGGVGEEAASHQNAPFFTWITEHRPFVTLKLAVSAEGTVGLADRRVALTSAEADAWLHQQRAEVDAVMVGADTVLVDDPRLTARLAPRERPLTRVIVDWRARTAPTAAVYSTLEAGPVIMMVTAAAADAAPRRMGALRERGVDIETFERPDVHAVLVRLAARDVVWLLLEGGPTLAAAVAAQGLVDRLQIVATPVSVTGGVPAFKDGLFDLVVRHPPRRIRLGPDTLLEFDVHRTH